MMSKAEITLAQTKAAAAIVKAGATAQAAQASKPVIVRIVKNEKRQGEKAAATPAEAEAAASAAASTAAEQAAKAVGASPAAAKKTGKQAGKKAGEEAKQVALMAKSAKEAAMAAGASPVVAQEAANKATLEAKADQLQGKKNKAARKEKAAKQVDPLAKETSDPEVDAKTPSKSFEVTPLKNEMNGLHPKVEAKINAMSQQVKGDSEMNRKVNAAYAQYKKNPNPVSSKVKKSSCGGMEKVGKQINQWRSKDPK